MLRLFALAAGIAGLLVILLLVFRDSKPESGASESNARTGQSISSNSANPAEREGSQRSEAPPAPLRMRSTAAPSEGGASGDSLETSFASEKPEPALAARHDSMIREVVAELAPKKKGSAGLQELECRSRHCRLRIGGGSEQEVGQLLNALQDERGFLGKAESMMLSRGENDAIDIYLRMPAEP